MSAGKPTPGPWSCHGERPTEVWSPCGSIMVADCKPEPHDREHQEQAAANAKLIAAAPDLASALEAVLREECGSLATEDPCTRAEKAAVAALRKAGRLP